MKKYLEIYVGSRGLLEGVGEVEKDNIEEWLESESVENKKWIEEDEEMDEDVKDELLGLWDWDKIDNGYYLGLGDEEVKYYVDMECEKFKEWEKKENEVNGIWEWNDMDDRKVLDILDYCNMYG
jgi:hypothetical protein